MVGEDLNPINTGKVGETQFSIAYYSTYTNSGPGNGDFFTNSVDINGGTMTTYPDYYEINDQDLYGAGPYNSESETPMAIATSSDDGDNLVTVWYQGVAPSLNWGYLHYKFSGNGYVYKQPKPAAIGNIKKGELVIYPNPANDMLTIEGSMGKKYMISDMLGRTITNGSISAMKQQVDVSTLLPGMYFINIEGGPGTQKAKFIKQ